MDDEDFERACKEFEDSCPRSDSSANDTVIRNPNFIEDSSENTTEEESGDTIREIDYQLESLEKTRELRNAMFQEKDFHSSTPVRRRKPSSCSDENEAIQKKIVDTVKVASSKQEETSPLSNLTGKC